MAQHESVGRGRVTRRDFLFVTAVGGGAILGVGLAASPTRAATKAAPKSVSYRPTPNGSQRCDNCMNFEAPGSCKLVDGPIAPSGWCTLYSARK